MAKTKLLEDIKADPSRFYPAPTDVVLDRRFSDAERLEILSLYWHFVDAVWVVVFLVVYVIGV